MNTASTISQRDAYKLMLKDYPDVMSIEQMCEILSISTKTGYRILREGKICCLKVGRAYPDAERIQQEDEAEVIFIWGYLQSSP